MARRSPRKPTRAPTASAKAEFKPEVSEDAGPPKRSTPSKPSTERKKRKVEKRREDFDGEADAYDSCASCAGAEEDEDSRPSKKRKTGRAIPNSTSTGVKSGKPRHDNMPLAERTAIKALKNSMYIGAHVSGAGGVHNAVTNALHIGANAFALFLKSQRKWESPPLAEDARAQFAALSKQHGYDQASHVLPHGSYLVNLAQADTDKAQQAYNNFVDDLKRCDTLGITLYNFHPGNTGGHPRGEACARIAAQLNRAHGETKSVVTVLENMAGQGNVVGSRFEDLRDIIAGVENKSRVGVCIDTCHAFAAGYDLRTPEAFQRTFAELDSVVGLEYLRAFHINDSKAPLGSNRDLHANIGTGFLGLRAFHSLVNHAPLAGLPMVLETPIDRKGSDGKTFEDKQIWADEIKLLERLIGMNAEGDDFKRLEAELWEKGTEERKKIQAQVDKKMAKDGKGKKANLAKAANGGAGGRKQTRKRASQEDEEEPPQY